MRITMKRGTIVLVGVINGIILFLSYRSMSVESRQRSGEFIKKNLDYVRNFVKLPSQDHHEDYVNNDRKPKRPLVWSRMEGIHKALPAYEKMRRALSNLQDYKPIFNRRAFYLDITGEMLKYKSVPSVGDSGHLKTLFTDVLETNRSLTIGVIGGALSRHNVCLRKSCIYVNLVAKWLTEMLDTRVTVRNAAIGMTSSDYFAWCLRPHLDVENVDIIMWEFATEDYVNRDLYLKQGLTSAGWPQEELTRQILDLPNRPYLMYFNFLSATNIRQRDCVNSEYFAGRHLGKHYNVTSVSWCNAICTQLWRRGFTPDDLIYADDLLSERAHQQGALFIINYFRSIMEEETLNLLNKTQHDERYINHLISLHDDFVQNTYQLVSRPKTVTTKPNVKSSNSVTNIVPKFAHVRLKDPQCWPASKPQFKKNHSLEIILNEGWELGYSYNENWYMSTAPNQRIKFRISIPPHHGDLNATIAVALVTCNYCGQALVWLNDQFGGAKLINGNAKKHKFEVLEAFAGVTPGNYSVTLKNMEERPFKIGAVMTSYEQPGNDTTVVWRSSEQFGGPRMWNKLKKPPL